MEYYIWDNKKKQFFNSCGHNGIFFTNDIDDAFLFPDKECAEDVFSLLEEPVLLAVGD